MKTVKQGTIISSIAGFYDVETTAGLFRTRARGVFRKQKVKPVVGDFVEIELGSEDKNSDDTNYLVKILPRHNFLKRPLLANVSDIVLVVTATEPEFSLNLLDRFLIFFESEGIDVNLYLSKQDLVDEAVLAKINEQLAYYQKIGYHLLDANSDIQTELLSLIEPKDIFVLAGQSGAGKSTLLNRIKEGVNQATAPISQSLNRGKHTTRTVELFEYGKGFIADTPGFSSIELQQIKIDELVNNFKEFVENTYLCKFRGCQHLNEPGCEIKRLVENGEILQSRYDNYLSMRTEISEHKLPEYRKL